MLDWYSAHGPQLEGSPTSHVSALLQSVSWSDWDRDASVSKAAVDLVTKECRAALAEISGTMEADQEGISKLKVQIAGRPAHNAKALQRRADILQLRINERKIVNRTLFILRSQQVKV